MVKQFRCPVCGYVHSGDFAPDFCPVCKAPGDSFVEITQGEKQYAAEHVVGIAAGVDAEVLEGLRMNFSGECAWIGWRRHGGRSSFSWCFTLPAR